MENLTIRQKLFINMVIAQAGFLVITIAGIMSENNTTLLVILNIIFGVLLAILGYIFTASITNNMEKFDKYFEQFLEFMSFKKNRYIPSDTKGNNEFAKLLQKIDATAKAYDTNLKSDMKVLGEIVITMDKVEQGIYGCRIHADTPNPMIGTLKNTINKMLQSVDSDMQNLVSTLKEYSKDDFRKNIPISSKIKGEMLEVLSSVNTLGDTLKKNAKRDLENGQQLEEKSEQMNRSVNTLAEKANQQAASLEETAAAVEEITSITRNNADNATQMAQLGGVVQGSVSKGQKLANDTASSMDEINSEVLSINEAITIIDQIAFQTNILSLNAAVEAATAGEAGKGFAVVAQEVRNLASRSADAANDIKRLVESAASKANSGKQISDEMIKGYGELNEHITKTIELIDDVSTSSKEQMQGIEQINDAVTMLDRVTQENAHEASSVAQIATQTQQMAETLVAEAKTKQF